MKTQNDILGTLCIMFGALLFLITSKALLFQLFMAYASYRIINYGLALLGKPSIVYYIEQYLGIRWY